MSDIKEIISKVCPTATFEEGECLLVNVPAADWYSFAKELKNNRELDFDVLTALIGMDLLFHIYTPRLGYAFGQGGSRES